jgi:hypothetical protein
MTIKFMSKNFDSLKENLLFSASRFLIFSDKGK